MTATVQVTIHSSQFPDAVRGDLLDSLRQGAINHKFHYDSIKQAQKWLALHDACSPARTRPEVATAYHRAFEQTSRIVSPGTVHVIGLLWRRREGLRPAQPSPRKRTVLHPD